MFGFRKKAPQPPPKQQEQTQQTQRTGDTNKEKNINDQLAKLGLIGIPGLDGGHEAADSDDELALENELNDLLGESDDEAGVNEDEDKELEEFLAADHAPIPPKRKSKTEISSSTSPKQSNTNSGGAVEVASATSPPTTILSSLQERLAKYQTELGKAVGNPTKIRRFGRIVKQYEDAIKDYQRGREVNFDELPTPPGCSPIPYGDNNSKPSIPPPTMEEVDPTHVAIINAPDPDTQSFLDLQHDKNDLPEPTIFPQLISPPAQKPPSPVPPSPAPVAADKEEENGNVSTSRPVPTTGEEDPILNEILARQKQYKQAAAKAKQIGLMIYAKEYLRVAMGLDGLITQHQNGETADLSTLPTPPVALSELGLGGRGGVDGVTGNLVTSSPEPPHQGSEGIEHQTLVKNTDTAASTEPDPTGALAPVIDMESLFDSPPPPTTVLEALEQRLAKYKSESDKAKANNEASKQRRMGRIVKQYEDAIKAHTKGLHVEFEELPTPPGYGPIPTSGKPAPAAAVGIGVGGVSEILDPKPKAPTPPSKQQPSAVINRPGNKPSANLTLQQKQLQAILLRQQQYKKAAVDAKQNGDLMQAKEYLKTMKGFDNLIEASRSGLPVDMATLPPAPASILDFESEGFELVGPADCIMPSSSAEDGGSVEEIFTKLESDLREQMAVCMSTRSHYKSIGDIGQANKFQQWAIDSKKDLDMLRLAIKSGKGIPKYTYETRVFNMTECNTDLTEDEIEICIMKGINYKATNDVDTFVKVELPYPSAEEVQTNKTHTVKNSINPEYNQTFKMAVQRSARNFPRFVHRHGFKLEVWSKGGIFRSNGLIGTATVKLTQLENKCTLHDAFDIVSNRKTVGKIEVKVRLRDPVLVKEIAQKRQKWVSIEKV